MYEREWDANGNESKTELKDLSMEDAFFESLSYHFSGTYGPSDVSGNLLDTINTYFSRTSFLYDERDVVKLFYFQLYYLGAELYEHDPLWQENLEWDEH